MPSLKISDLPATIQQDKQLTVSMKRICLRILYQTLHYGACYDANKEFVTLLKRGHRPAQVSTRSVRRWMIMLQEKQIVIVTSEPHAVRRCLIMNPDLTMQVKTDQYPEIQRYTQVCRKILEMTGTTSFSELLRIDTSRIDILLGIHIETLPRHADKSRENKLLERFVSALLNDERGVTNVSQGASEGVGEKEVGIPLREAKVRTKSEDGKQGNVRPEDPGSSNKDNELQGEMSAQKFWNVAAPGYGVRPEDPGSSNKDNELQGEMSAQKNDNVRPEDPGSSNKDNELQGEMSDREIDDPKADISDNVRLRDPGSSNKDNELQGEMSAQDIDRVGFGQFSGVRSRDPESGNGNNDLQGEMSAERSENGATMWGRTFRGHSADTNFCKSVAGNARQQGEDNPSSRAHSGSRISVKERVGSGILKEDREALSNFSAPLFFSFFQEQEHSNPSALFGLASVNLLFGPIYGPIDPTTHAAFFATFAEYNPPQPVLQPATITVFSAWIAQQYSHFTDTGELTFQPTNGYAVIQQFLADAHTTAYPQFPETNDALDMFRLCFAVSLSVQQQRLIMATVRNLELWQHTLSEWADQPGRSGQGWNPANVPGLLDRYRRKCRAVDVLFHEHQPTGLTVIELPTEERVAYWLKLEISETQRKFLEHAVNNPEFPAITSLETVFQHPELLPETDACRDILANFTQHGENIEKSA